LDKKSTVTKLNSDFIGFKYKLYIYILYWVIISHKNIFIKPKFRGQRSMKSATWHLNSQLYIQKVNLWTFHKFYHVINISIVSTMVCKSTKSDSVWPIFDSIKVYSLNVTFRFLKVFRFWFLSFQNFFRFPYKNLWILSRQQYQWFLKSLIEHYKMNVNTNNYKEIEPAT